MTEAEELCPGIRAAVELLRSNDFETIDSGDGSHFRAGMECACEEPMIACATTRHHMAGASHRLMTLLGSRGIDVHIEAAYSPKDEVAILLVMGKELLNLDGEP